MIRGSLHALLLALLLLAPDAASAQGGAAIADPPRGDVRIVVFGDFNGPYGSLDYPAPVTKAMDAIVGTWRPDLLLSPGDVVAGQSRSLPDEAFPAMWAAFDRAIAAPLREAGVPYAVALGNHDASSLRSPGGDYLYARDRHAAEAYWSAAMYEGNHAYVDRSAYPFDYAFRSGAVFVAIVDASSATVSPAQRAWLDAVLGHPSAVSAAVRVVVGHLPLAPVGRGRDGPGETLSDADALRAVMEEGRVDLYVSGHHAAYYPGRLGGLELLFAGGVGARRLLAGDAAPRSTATVVDVDLEPLSFRYATFDLATMELVEPESLPPAIGPVRRSERVLPR